MPPSPWQEEPFPACKLDAYFQSTGSIVGPVHSVSISVKKIASLKGRILHTGYVSWISNGAPRRLDSGDTEEGWDGIPRADQSAVDLYATWFSCVARFLYVLDVNIAASTFQGGIVICSVAVLSILS